MSSTSGGFLFYGRGVVFPVELVSLVIAVSGLVEVAVSVLVVSAPKESAPVCPCLLEEQLVSDKAIPQMMEKIVDFIEFVFLDFILNRNLKNGFRKSQLI